MLVRSRSTNLSLITYAFSLGEGTVYEKSFLIQYLSAEPDKSLYRTIN